MSTSFPGRRRGLLLLAAVMAFPAWGQGVVINEIMYHPFSAAMNAEDTRLEYIELFNPGLQPVSLTGWQFTQGVEFTFPDTILPAGGYLVVAADVATFQAAYPGVGNVMGGWSGQLSDSGETIQLQDNWGGVVDEVPYADQGDWSVRELGPVDHSHRGWQWRDDHDGGGKSLELLNPGLPNEYGRNWAAGIATGGTPGRRNSVASDNIAPLIVGVQHSPIIPGPGDSVTVVAMIVDEVAQGAVVQLRYRMDHSTYSAADPYPQENQADFAVVTMFDDGSHGDGASGDGWYGTRIPAQPNGAIVEFYVEATDSAGQTRTWPAPSLVEGESRQVTNALYRVDASLDPLAYWKIGSQPLYYVVMTEMERAHLALIGSRSNGEEDTDAAMNGTFISIDGAGVTLRYRAAVRNRGHGTRSPAPNNFHVGFPHDDLWKDVSSISFNTRYTHAQIIGAAIFQMTGLAAADAAPAQLRINGANLASAGLPMYGVYVRLETFNGAFAARHFPGDPNGNLYSCFRDNGEADLRYLGPQPNSYRPSYFKESNAALDDWSDLIHMLEVLNNAPDATYVQDVGKVINIPQWLHYIALDSCLLNYETGLHRGIGDDYFMYCGVTDRRFVLIPHDLDTILDQGQEHGAVDQSVFTIVTGVGGSNGVDGLQRFFAHPEIIPLYYQALLDVVNGAFRPERLDGLFDQVLGGFTPAAPLNAMKQFVRNRRAAVLNQIPQALTVTLADAPVSESGYAARPPMRSRCPAGPTPSPHGG